MAFCNNQSYAQVFMHDKVISLALPADFFI